MTRQTDHFNSPNIEETRHELREGLKTSREIVRQSRILIELSECDSASAANDNDHAAH